MFCFSHTCSEPSEILFLECGTRVQTPTISIRINLRDLRISTIIVNTKIVTYSEILRECSSTRLYLESLTYLAQYIDSASIV